MPVAAAVQVIMARGHMIMTSMPTDGRSMVMSVARVVPSRSNMVSRTIVVDGSISEIAIAHAPDLETDT